MPFDSGVASAFPGRILKVGVDDAANVRLVQQRLNVLGCGPVHEDGVFDAERTRAAVRLFQARFTDVRGMPLEIDGKVDTGLSRGTVVIANDQYGGRKGHGQFVRRGLSQYLV